MGHGRLPRLARAGDVSKARRAHTPRPPLPRLTPCRRAALPFPQDLRAQFQGEREALLDDYRSLARGLKLKNLVVAAFIPPQYQDVSEAGGRLRPWPTHACLARCRCAL